MCLTKALSSYNVYDYLMLNQDTFNLSTNITLLYLETFLVRYYCTLTRKIRNCIPGQKIVQILKFNGVS